MRAEGLSRLLRFDLTNDRIVTSEEFDKAMRISEASGGGGRSREVFDRADGNHDGSVTFDEMLTLPPEQRAQIDQEAARLSSATIAIDPTPSTNFTLEDARILVDAVFAAYDTGRDGVLSSAERKAAGARS